MDAVELARRQLEAVYRQVDDVLKDTTDEELNWMPPGTANTIGGTVVHMLSSEDYYVQSVLRGQVRIWELEGWGEKVGLATSPGPGQGWDEIRRAKLALVPLLAYKKAVRDATEAFLAELAAADLDREVRYIGGERTAADVLATLAVHSTTHAGEIAALKGFQGAKGLPV